MLLVSGPALAEARPDPLTVRFERTAGEAREALAEHSGERSFEQLKKFENLRERLAKDRDLAMKLADSGTLDTRILEAQIKELGPLPEDGKSEPSAIAQRREELDRKHADLMGPVLSMREAHARAATLVSEIDGRINDLNNRTLFRQDRSPLNPALWISGIADIGGVAAAASSAIGGAIAKRGLGKVLLAIGLAMTFAIGGPYLIFWLWRRADRAIQRKFAEARLLATKLVLNLLRDIGNALVFGIAVTLFAFALIVLLSPYLARESLVGGVIVAIIATMLLAGAEWLGKAIIYTPFEELRLVTFAENRARAVMNTVRIFGFILASEFVLEFVERAANATASVTGLVSTLLVVTGAGALWRLGSLASSADGSRVGNDGSVEDASEPTSRRIELAKPASRALKIFALAIVVTAVAGYIMLARHIFISSVLTIAVVAIAIYLHRSFKMILTAVAAGPLNPYRRIVRLLPMVTGLVILFSALFIIALIWGYRLQEIGDLLVVLRNGIEFGDIRLSAGDVFTFAIVFVVGYAVTRWVQQFLKISILPEFDLDRGGQSAIVTGIGYLGILLAAVVAIASTGLDLSNLAFIAGALSVGLGFGLQSTIENFTSGVILLVERPIKEGDWIEVGEYSGLVRKIAVRSTQIETFDRHHIIIPNSQLITGSVKNLSFSGGPARVPIIIGVSYDTDLDRAKSLLLEIAAGNSLVLKDPEPFVVHSGFGDSSIDLILFCFVEDVTTGAGAASQINFEITRRFAEEEIEIPFPQRDVHVRSGTEKLAGPSEALLGHG